MWEKFLATDLGVRAAAWYNRNVSAGWYKSTSFLANLFGIVVAMLPDGINFVLQNTDLVTTALLPTLDAKQQAQFLFWVNVAAAVFRVFKQVSVQKAGIKQAAEEGKVVPLPPSGVPVSPEFADASPVPNEQLDVSLAVDAVRPPVDTHL